jgi:uncharacterized repeat protein (TIGR03943 family)
MKTFSRALSAVILLAWGTLLLYFYLGGRLNEYLIPAYRPWVGVSGAVMLLIAASIAWSLRPGSRRRSADLYVADGLEDASSIRGGTAMQVMAFALLAVPIWAAAGMSKDSFSATAILNRGIVSDPSQFPDSATRPSSPPAPLDNTPPVNDPNQPPLPGATPAPPDKGSDLDPSQYLKKNADGSILAEVTDLLFASDDDSMRPAFDGKNVEMIGQFMPASSGIANRFQIVRMFMVCCAADARPVAVQIESKDKPKLAEMSWARVVGKVTFPVEGGHRIPVVQATSLKVCDPPAEAMLY